MQESVVITGMGVVTPVGIGVSAYWDNLLSGKTGIDKISRFDPSGLVCRIGAEVKGFEPKDYMTAKIARESDFFTQYALATIKMALEDAGLNLEKEDPYRVGIVFGTSIGGITTFEEQRARMAEKGPKRVSPHFISKFIPNMAAAQAAIIYKIYGPSLTVTTACASGADAVGLGARILKAGDADVVIAGGSESLFITLVFAGLYAARAVSTRNEEPQKACRPFDRQRDGMVMGEGAGTVILETLSHALKRGGRIHAQLAGYAASNDGFHITAPASNGHGQIHCMRTALANAGLEPADIDYINAHGTSTILGDTIETESIKAVFGEGARKIPVSSTKGATGHLMGGGGVTELIACIKAIQEGVVPPTMNYEEPDLACDLDYVPNCLRKVEVSTAMSNSFGFGGQNACLIVRKINEYYKR